jgi:hypothetical protein
VHLHAALAKIDDDVLQSGRLLLADDMGLGKTVQAIAACAALFAAGRVRHGVILVPASLKSQWLREWQQTSDAPVRIVDGSPAERAALYRVCNGLAQLEFEQVWSECANQKPTPRRLDMMCSPKLGELRQLVSDIVIEQGRTVVIFSQWRRMLRLASWAVSDLLSAADLRAVYFTGAESQKQRTRSVIELHDDPATRVMLLSDAGGVGLNLQRAASCCINLELPWNPAVLEQRIGRIYRLGQERPIDVYNLVSEQGIEARIATIVSDKQALFTGLFDGSSNELRFEAGASMRSQLERLIDPAPGPAVLASDAEVDGDADPIASTGTSDALVAAADEAVDARNAAANGNNSAGDGRAAVATVTPTMALPIPADVARVVSSLDVRRTDDGGIAIAAPPETAATLAALFGKLSELLASQASPDRHAPRADHVGTS